MVLIISGCTVRAADSPTNRSAPLRASAIVPLWLSGFSSAPAASLKRFIPSDRPRQTMPVAQGDVRHARLAQEAGHADAGAAGAGDHRADRADLLADDLERVPERRQHRGAGPLHV